MNELAYPFAEKEKQYREYDVSMLRFALTDARWALSHAESMAQAGCPTAGRKGPGWRADDVHTIAKVLKEKSLTPSR
jgi:hypothetical protein